MPRAIAGKVDPYTRAYRDEVPAKVTIRLRDGRELTRERRGYPGFKSTPLGWPEVIATFGRLAASVADEVRRAGIVEAVRTLEGSSLGELARLFRFE